MSALPEIIRLFTKLASDLRRSDAYGGGNDDDSDETSTLISSLSRSLNSDDRTEPRVRVLDAALSLLGFKTPEVRAAQIESQLRAIIALLSSSVSCKTLRFGRDDAALLQVGSSIHPGDRGKLIRACSDVLANVNGRSAAGLCDAIIYVALRAAVFSSTNQAILPSLPAFDEDIEELNDGGRSAIVKLTGFLTGESSVSNDGIPLRLLLWYLDPLGLRHDISEILQESIRRPFLCIKEELHDRMAWRSIIIYMVTSPTIFMETRALLHNWFLLTGLTSVLDLQIAIVSVILDVLSRPMWWGVPMDVGLKYPFSHAYFSDKHHELLIILSGYISCERFLDLASLIEMANAPTTKYQNPAHSSDDIFWHNASIDNKSIWAMVLQFPSWFYFVISLIFSDISSLGSHMSKVIDGSVKSGATNYTKLQHAAIQYISWVLSPTDVTHRHLLADHIQEISRSWITRTTNCSYEKKFYSNAQKKHTVSRGKKLRIPKVSDCDKLYSTTEDDNNSTVRLWLKDFDAISAKFSRRTICSALAEAKGKQNARVQPNLLFLRIPLGILIWCSSCLDESGCELLLHYVATGDILQMEAQEKTKIYLGQNDLTFSIGDGHKWALDGASLIFSFFDIIEDISILFFDNEDIRVNFFCQMKDKVGRYLLRCMKTLVESHSLQSQIDDCGGIYTLVDLLSRLRRWMIQGGEMFDGYKMFNDVADDISKMLAVPNMHSKEN